MHRSLLAVTGFILVCVTVASAQTTRPIVNDKSLSPQQLDELHREAVDLMRAGKWDKATQVFDRVYNATPAAQRSRPLVLNRAVLDLLHKGTIMRSVKDLSDYLAKHRAEDELATNMLGACLNVAANNPRVKASAPWQAALKEWDRRNYLLDHSRPGWRRWGTQWVTEDQTKAREEKTEDLRRSIDEQSTYIERLLDDAYSLGVQQQSALTAQSAFGQARAGYADQRSSLQTYVQSVTQYKQQLQEYNRYQQQRGKAPLSPQSLPDPSQGIQNLQRREGQLSANEFDAAMSAQSIGADLNAAYRQIMAARGVLQKYQDQLAAIRPSWPERYDAVDVSATAPPPPSTQPAESRVLTAKGATPTTQPEPIARPSSPADLYAQPTTSP